MLTPRLRLFRLIAVLAILNLAIAHSHIPYLVINGLSYPGFIPSLGSANPPEIVGWATTVKDDGYVSPSNYSTPDIICHRGGTPSQAHVPVTPGDKILFQWNGWPQSHKGPAMSYLAPCNGTDGCASVDKTELEFFKIDNSAPTFLNESGGPPGFWATDVLIANNNSWLVEVPPTLTPGPYVLRHEIIALHYAAQTNGAQNYPQCFNLWVEGDATASASSAGGTPVDKDQGGLAVDFYKADDPGIAIDVYKKMTTYEIPGPTVVSGAAPIPVVSQTLSVPTAAGTPVMVMGSTAMPYPTSVAKVDDPVSKLPRAGDLVRS